MQAVWGIGNDCVQAAFGLSLNPIKAIGVHHRRSTAGERLLPGLQLTEVLLVAPHHDARSQMVTAALFSNEHLRSVEPQIRPDR